MAIVVLLIGLILSILVVGYIVVSIRDALGIPKTVLPHANITIIVVTPILFMYVCDPVRRRLSMRSYVSWLKTFDDEHVQPERQITRIWRFISMRFRRLWVQRAPRGVTQVRISLLPLYQGESSRNEFPGEVFLE